MNQIIEYIIISESDINSVMKKVNALVNDGYQPFGSVSTAYAPDTGSIYIAQAVVKYAIPN